MVASGARAIFRVKFYREMVAHGMARKSSIWEMSPAGMVGLMIFSQENLKS